MKTQMEPYQVLGLDSTASLEEARTAWLKRVRVLHPDRFDPIEQRIEWEHATEMLQEVNAAWDKIRNGRASSSERSAATPPPPPRCPSQPPRPFQASPPPFNPPPRPAVPPRPSPGTNNPFLFSGRWGRARYSFLIICYTAVLFFTCNLSPPVPDLHAGIGDYPGVTLLVMTLWFWLMTCAAVKRMHDINWPAWGILVLPAGLTWLFLGLKRGQSGVNRYGEQPPIEFPGLVPKFFVALKMVVIAVLCLWVVSQFHSFLRPPSASPSPDPLAGSATTVPASGAEADSTPFDPDAFIKKAKAWDFFNKGHAKQIAGDSLGASSDYTIAIQINPSYPEPYFYRGGIYFQNGSLDSASDDYEAFIHLRPDDPQGYLNHGITEVKLSKLSQAIEDYNRAIELNPEYADAFLNRGVAETKLNSLDDAIRDFLSVINIDNKNDTAYFNLGACYAGQNDWKDSVTAYSWAIKLSPNDPEYYLNRGRSRVGAGDLTGANTDFGTAIQLKPDLAVAYYARSLVEEQQGDADSAAADVAKARYYQAANSNPTPVDQGSNLPPPPVSPNPMGDSPVNTAAPDQATQPLIHASQAEIDAWGLKPDADQTTPTTPSQSSQIAPQPQIHPAPRPPSFWSDLPQWRRDQLVNQYPDQPNIAEAYNQAVMAQNPGWIPATADNLMKLAGQGIKPRVVGGAIDVNDAASQLARRSQAGAFQGATPSAFAGQAAQQSPSP